ncbi:MAG TPA: DUF952 domain-containing protein [Candidatus Acidoferrum sp.]|nr:DUF952 domain-containing protein [Candidatus Acidoferrum sp.]
MLTYHLTSAEDWAGLAPGSAIRPPSLAGEGFIHCTTGADEMVATANRHYREDPRAFIVLTVDLDRVPAPWRYDSPDTRYPHVYGELPRDAIVRARPIARASDGSFLPFED